MSFNGYSLNKFHRFKSAIEKKQNKINGYYVQVYNNNVIDDYVINSDEANAKPTQAMLYANLSILNKPHVYQNYNRILNSKYTSNNAVQQMLLKNKANQRLETVVESELGRISENLNYVEQVLGKYEINLDKYRKLAQKQSAVASRKRILEQCVNEKNIALTEYGINLVPHSFSYRNLDITAEALNRQTQMIASFDEYDAINQEARFQGLDEPYTKKQWVWTGEGVTTRHQSNDGQVVGFNEPFEITNDANGDVDMLMFPSDPNGSWSNTAICYCRFFAF